MNEALIWFLVLVSISTDHPASYPSQQGRAYFPTPHGSLEECLCEAAVRSADGLWPDHLVCVGSKGPPVGNAGPNDWLVWPDAIIAIVPDQDTPAAACGAPIS